MAKNRVIYQSEALFAGQKTGVTDTHTSDPTNIKQIHRVQSANYAFNISRTDVNQFGELAAIDRVVLDTPTVSLDFSYLLSNFANEENLGFTIDQIGTSEANRTSALSGILNKTADERNYFIQTSREGEDAVGDTDRDFDFSVDAEKPASTIGIGNGFLTSYSSEASVGGFPTVSIAVEAMNMNFSTGTQSIPNPAIDRINGTASSNSCSLPPVSGSAGLTVAEGGGDSGILAISTLRPGDITIKIAEHAGTSAFGTDAYSLGGAKMPGVDGDTTTSANIQSYNISFDLGRTPIQRLGNRFAFAREVDFPVNVSLSVDALLTDLTTGNLNDLIDCEKSYNVEIELKGITGSACDSDKTTICKYMLKDLKPDAQSYSSSIGDNKNVTLDFSAQIGGPRQNDVGLFMEGMSHTNSVDVTSPTFTLSQITTAGAEMSVSRSGDMLFTFDSAITDSDGNDLQASDFVIQTGVGGDQGSAATPEMGLLLVADDANGFVLVNNENDRRFLLRMQGTSKTALDQRGRAGSAVKTIVSGHMASTSYKDLAGNTIGATGTVTGSYEA
tara:strand:+ start:39 stop:1712 length:1674 start_codon:yes stop_codon:yes gene_type:complete